ALQDVQNVEGLSIVLEWQQLAGRFEQLPEHPGRSKVEDQRARGEPEEVPTLKPGVEEEYLWRDPGRSLRDAIERQHFFLPGLRILRKEGLVPIRVVDDSVDSHAGALRRVLPLTFLSRFRSFALSILHRQPIAGRTRHRTTSQPLADTRGSVRLPLRRSRISYR